MTLQFLVRYGRPGRPAWVRGLRALLSRRLGDGPRRTTMVATILLACGGWALVRSHGITGDGAGAFSWRWSETPEERLLAAAPGVPTAPPPAQVDSAQADSSPVERGAQWPAFRGPGRDSIVPGVRIETDWSRSPPVELWRRPIGPGWSSFAVHGEFIYTQEQRGDDHPVLVGDLLLVRNSQMMAAFRLAQTGG